MIKIGVISNGNVSILGVYLGMHVEDAAGILMDRDVKMFRGGLTVKVEHYTLNYYVNKYGFVDGVLVTLCGNGNNNKVILDVAKSYRRLFTKSNEYQLLSKNVVEKDGRVTTNEIFKSDYIEACLGTDINVPCLSYGNSVLLKIRLTIVENIRDVDLNQVDYVKLLYKHTIFRTNNKFNYKHNFAWINLNHIYMLIIGICFVIGMFIYAFSHRYQVVYNGRGIIDKWTGTVEVVKCEK